MVQELPQMTATNYAYNVVDTGASHLYEPQLATMGRVVPSISLPANIWTPPDMNKTQRRLVQIFIADPDENVPLDKCLLYSGEQKVTDLTDQELFFEVDVRTLLETHNAVRTKLVNKTVKERVEHLEPARVRDLKMNVVTIAQF